MIRGCLPLPAPPLPPLVNDLGSYPSSGLVYISHTLEADASPRASSPAQTTTERSMLSDPRLAGEAATPAPRRRFHALLLLAAERMPCRKGRSQWCRLEKAKWRWFYGSIRL